jgi:HAD superfamily hydrolase (TIGR01450 family)
MLEKEYAMNFTNPDITILKDKKLYIFDMDGTIYLGNRVFPFAIRFIKNLRQNGKRVLFFTNNASHSPSFYLEKLTRLGFEPTMDEIMTSGDVTAEFLLRHRAGQSVYLVGTDDLVNNFRERGINLIDGSSETADIVIPSFDTTLTCEKLDNACRLVRNGAEYLCTHPDFNCPT